jgi:putative two-component system response regulator
MQHLELLRRLVRLRNVDLDGHGQRVGQYAAFLCQSLNLDQGFAEEMGQACSLHDLGKVVLPDGILLKPTALTSDEWTVMRGHSAFGYEILKDGTDPITRLSACVALTHHECFDGSGYPHGLQGRDIPLEGRIVSICDVYDALRANRVYRRGLEHHEAMEIILEGDTHTSPSQFDPDLLRVFAHQSERFAELFDQHRATPG